MKLLMVIVCSCLSVANAVKTVIDLNGRWTVSNTKRGISIPGQVPGSMYTALLNSSKITDPLYKDNDVKLAWVGHENWTYTRHFELSSKDVQSAAVLLVAEGIDTIATIFINDKLVGKSSNMFLKYIWDIKSQVKPGNNSVRFEFESAVTYAANKATKLPYTIPPNCPSSVQHGECHVNLIRKEQCSFSWDWGPSFPTQGIWKPIYIQAFDSALIEFASAEVWPAGMGWELVLGLDFHVAGQTVSGILDVELAGTSIKVSRNISLTLQKQWVTLNISIPQTVPIKRWWPNGYGSQTLYDLKIKFTTSPLGEISNRTLRIGFRTVKLVQKPVSADINQGLTFYFTVNGLPIFFKGSNWIPADSFQERITKDGLRKLLQSAAVAHINSMRVWGGGVYESEDFCDLADELGIMIWQDLMFSVALYPTDAEFLHSVTQEVTYQVRRLKHRPSILLWAGSNENEAGLRQNWFGTSSNFTLYYNDFVKLYVTTVKAVVNKEDAGREYLTSSPSNGAQSEKEGYVAKDPSSERYGDIHYYDYSIDQWVPNHFRVPRFTSEYGIQAWCDYTSLVSVFEPTDMNYDSAQAEHRQHHGRGTSEMEMQVKRHINLPSANAEPKHFKSMIYLTQINQAMSIKTQTEHYRRHQSTLLADGRGLTMGALYWQLNDIWQAPTWASIDYNGYWKMLHYYALKFFNRVLVSPYVDGDSLNIYIVIDEIPIVEVQDPSTKRLSFEPLHQLHDDLPKQDVEDLTSKHAHELSGTLGIEIYAWHSLTPLRKWTVPYKLNKTAESVYKKNLSSLMSEAGCARKSECFISVYLNDRASAFNNWLLLEELKNSSLLQANISITKVEEISASEYAITLSTNVIAPFVWLEAGPVLGHFSDNGFLMFQPTVTVQFRAWHSVNLATFRKSLSVTSLLDIYKTS